EQLPQLVRNQPLNKTIHVQSTTAEDQRKRRLSQGEGCSPALVPHIRRTYYSDQGRPVETADIIVPAAALCEIVYEIPISRQQG
ncbi:hypothetical protein ACFQ63_32270, partial [Streptomyces wedmorensis]